MLQMTMLQMKTLQTTMQQMKMLPVVQPLTSSQRQLRKEAAWPHWAAKQKLTY